MKFIKPALLVAVLILSACQSAPPSPLATAARPSGGYSRGIDLATDTSNMLGEMRGRPWLEFVARYYRDPTSRYPALSPDEARRLSAAGYKIVTVWEWHSSTPSYFSYPSGYNDALSAVRQAKAVGQPPGSAIYFAVDFNARGAVVEQVGQYFRGVNAGMAAAGGGRPEYRVGVYGSGAVCAEMRGAGLAQYAWLSGSSAWDGTAGYDGWHIRQAPAAARFAQLSFDHDANEARADYGGFQVGNYPRIDNPASAIVAVAAAAPAAAATVVASAVTSIAPPPTTPAPPPPAPMVVAALPQPVPQPAPYAPPPVAAPPVAAIAAVAPPPAARPVASPPRMSPAEIAALATEDRESEPPPRSAARSIARATEEPVHGRAVAKASAPRHKVTAVAANVRASAAPTRRLAAAEPRETERKASVSKRSQEHTARVQAAATATARAAEKPPRHVLEQHHEHTRRATDS